MTYVLVELVQASQRTTCLEFSKQICSPDDWFNYTITCFKKCKLSIT
jgi:hypothetical protein